ncbi:hypothetical protein [Helicobacter sp. T3_23-1059]
MGLRAKGYIGYSNYFKELYKHTFSNEYDATSGYYDKNTGTYYQEFESVTNGDYVFSLDSHAIQYGVELAYIWDFLDKGKHTIGLDIAPLGLEASTYMPKHKYKATGSTTYTWTGTGTNNTGFEDTFTESNNASRSQAFETHTKFAYTASIGLHYYYNVNHQIFASYKIRTYSTTTTATLKFKDYVSPAKISNVSNHAFLLGYAYKF